MPALEIHGLTKSFSGKVAISSINMHLPHTQRLVVVGYSGAGKSTLLRLISGLEKPDQGSVIIDGVNSTHLPAGRRNVAFVSQDYALYPQMTVQQNLDTALSSLKLTTLERRQRIAEALHWFRIDELTRRLPSQLSGGQAQRVALAKAVVRYPKLLLVDEPLSQIDYPLREELRELLRHVSEHYRTLLIMVTHDPLDALRLGQQIAVLEQGRLMQMGSPTDLTQAPQGRAVAELLSPWGVNWLSIECLRAIQDSPLKDEICSALLLGKQVGFKPEAASFRQPMVTNEQQDALVMTVELDYNQALGFADLLIVKLAGQRLRCLSLSHQATSHQLTLVVARQQLLIL